MCIDQPIFDRERESPLRITDGVFVPAADVDPAFVREKKDGLLFLDALAPKFRISGIRHPKDNGNEYYRLDAAKRTAYSPANASLAECTAGAQIRFRTDAEKLTLRITLRAAIAGMHHFTDRGAYGIDLYTGTGTKRTYLGAMMQTFADSPVYNEQTVALPGGMQEVTINLPLYGGINSFVIGMPENALLGLPLPRAIEKPIAFYGSSITQGGCVSRPANMYSHILCRMLDADCLNLGFSGSAMGEQSIAEYLATREMSAFVMDYDYNSTSLESLANTHYPFYKTVRRAHPDLPIVIVTHPYYHAEAENDKARKDVIRETVRRAAEEGDTRVEFVDSEAFFPLQMRDLYAVDALHPNDLGQFMMARAIYPALKRALQV